MSESLLTPLLAFARVNLVLALAVLVVLAVRRPVRRWFGAQLAYGLWALAPLAAATALMPLSPAPADHPQALRPLWTLLAGALAVAPSAVWTGIWIGGALAGLALVAVAQRAFARRERAGEAGPAVVGILTPRLVMPSRLKAEFTEEERALIRAHERAHMDRGDPRVNAWVTLAQLVFWFNPMVHLAAHFLRLDQELACDATVMEKLRAAQGSPSRRRYAETLLKTQLAAQALPLGCQWGSGRWSMGWVRKGDTHPLLERIGALRLPRPSPRRRDIGLAAVAGLGVLLCGAAWAAQPAKIAEAGVRILWVDMTPR